MVRNGDNFPAVLSCDAWSKKITATILTEPRSELPPKEARVITSLELVPGREYYVEHCTKKDSKIRRFVAGNLIDHKGNHDFTHNITVL